MNVMVHAGSTSFARREPPPLSLPSGNLFTRLLTAKTLASLWRDSGITVADVAAQMWPNDLVLRAAVAPAMTSVAGWAAELAQLRVADAVEALGPASAAAQILKQCLLLNWDGAGQISVPGFVAEFGNAGFVAEGVPIPVRQLAATAALLKPHKLAAIAAISREQTESSNAEAMITDVLVKAAGRMMDEVLFDANPEDAARPKGLRNGIAALTPSNNTEMSEAFVADIGALIGALAPVAGNGPYIIVASPARAALMHIRFIRQAENIMVFGSSAVINDVLGIAPQALVAAISPDPQVETSNAATLVMDTAPGAAGTMTERGLFQTDSIAIKVRWPVTWALRDARGFAWLTPTWK